MNNKSDIKIVKDRGLFSRSLEVAISGFSGRSKAVIWSRYGLDGSGVKTLQEIGEKFGITRERVRQIIREVCKKIKSKSSDVVFFEARKKILFTLNENNGIIEKDKFLEILSGKNEKEKGAVRFFLECLDDIDESEIKNITKRVCFISGFDFNLWKGIKNEAIEILGGKKAPTNETELIEMLLKNSKKSIDKNKILSYLEVSKEVKKNIFGKWGLVNCREISPKGTRDKAYLVLKEMKKPLHFRDIANEIDRKGLSKRKTHPQTVHNELIKDSKFVLIGRGIYALSEWGYKKGTVRDVLEDILVKNSKAMSKEDIIKEVLNVRQVKKSTIIINLNNYFKKNKEEKFFIKK